MQLRLSQDRKFITVVPEKSSETTFLSTFPGLLKEGMIHYFPNKPNLTRNIVKRLAARIPDLKMAPEIHRDYSNQYTLKQIPEDFKFYTTPEEHQHVALRFLYTVGSGGLLLDPGMGKTKVYLDFIALMGFKKTLIVCPKALRFVWEEEAAFHRPDKSVYVVETTDWEKEIVGIRAADIIVVNYNKAVTLEEKLSKFGFDAISLDEALIKDYRTDRTKALTRIASGIPVRNLMSGTLINNSPIDSFAPLRFMEPALCGRGVTNFKARYCVTNQKNPNIIFGYRHLPEIREMLESCCIVMTKDKWLKLPEKKFHKILVPMADDQRAAFWDLKTNYLAEVQGRTLSVDTPLVMASKLMQISNGFMYYNDEADVFGLDELFGEASKAPKKKEKAAREVLYFEQQPKIDKLVELLTETIPDRKTIIWYNMTAEKDLIVAALAKHGISHEVIMGGEKDVGGKVRMFNRTPSLRCLVCQAKSVNYGITVLGTSKEKLEELDITPFPGISPEVFTQVFYSMSFSLEMFLQQQDRIHRIGQKHPCDYHILLSQNPMESRVMDALDDKIEIKQALLVDIVSSIKP